MEHSRSARAFSLVVLFLFTVVFGGASALVGLCGPFTDVADLAFCPYVLEIFTLGITTGTSPTTYDPAGNVSRLQMAAFLSRSVDGVLKRAGRRAALKRFWIPQNDLVLDVTTLGTGVGLPASDGVDVWVPSFSGASVSRVRASDGVPLATWTGAYNAEGALSAIGKVFVTGFTSPGMLYRVDPRQPGGAVTTVASSLGNLPAELAFDGARIWTANGGVPGSVSIVTPGPSLLWTVTTVTSGFWAPAGIVFDGANVWVTDNNAQTLLKLSPTGSILQTVTLGGSPAYPLFDGGNIWVTNIVGFVSVVRAGTGAVVTTLSGNGLNYPLGIAFDGERILVANYYGDSVSVWKAADLTVIGNFPTGPGSSPFGACSDGVNFFVTFRGNQLARF